MSEERERRYSQRIQFANGRVYCKERSSLGVFQHYSESYLLNDITKSGVGFSMTKTVARGDLVNLKIEIPGQKNIQVKGQVRWVSEQDDKQELAVGVQFLPFGSMKHYNSFNTRERLENLIGGKNSFNQSLH